MYARYILLFCTLFLVSARPADNSIVYRFPLQTDEVMLAGTFGELRPDHFHSGIDIKTGGESGRPVYAVAEGYIYRIKISPVGYGKALFIRHPDGTFSVYGHLDHFADEIEEFIFQKQFVSRRWEQDVFLGSDRLRVKKADLIAFSGNTGHSHGPHLHFEIRNSQDEPVNPLTYYPQYITDHIPPILQGIALTPLDASSRVGGSPDKVEYALSGGNGDYILTEPVEITGRVGLEYRGFDVLDAAPNHCGINHARLYLDNNLRFEFDLSHFAFDEKKFINVHTDYGFNRRTGRLYERAWRADGNALEAYPVSVQNGAITLPDYELHTLRLELSDEFGNTTRFTARLRKQAVAPGLPTSLPGGSSRLTTRLRGNEILAEVSEPSTAHLSGIEVLYPDGEKVILPPVSYRDGSLSFVLALDGRRYPEHLRDPVTGQRIPFRFRKTIYPGKNNLAELGELQLYFPFGAAFDTLHLEMERLPGNPGTYSSIYQVGDPNIPLLEPFLLNFSPEATGGPVQKVVARKSPGGEWKFVGRELRDDGTLYASSAEMGLFCVMADSLRPQMKPINFTDGGQVPGSQGTLALEVRDNFSGINGEKILMSIDGNWVLGEYDQKSATLSHTLRRRPGPGRHLLEVMVYDNAGNLTRSLFVLNF